MEFDASKLPSDALYLVGAQGKPLSIEEHLSLLVQLNESSIRQVELQQDALLIHTRDLEQDVKRHGRCPHCRAPRVASQDEEDLGVIICSRNREHV